ncbi:MAG: tRNA pseudouridine(38-40) synthase TruA [Thermaceae bacterium]
MRRVLLFVEYDGTGFAGLQRQRPGLRTVQGTLEEALHRLGGIPKAVAAGRTDRGVHALRMPFHANLPESLPLERIPLALNRHLPEDLKVVETKEVPPHFHARKDAKSRTYFYRLLIREAPLVLERHRALGVRPPLDLEAMAQALPKLLGEHDFSGFSVREERDPVRTLFDAWMETRGEEVRIFFKGQSFLRGQVRGMVGALLSVGKGKLSLEAFAEILNGGRSPLWAPPQGLYFLEAEY